MRVVAVCAAVILCGIWFTPEGEWLLSPSLLVIPWWIDRHRVSRQMTRELDDLIASGGR